MAAPLPCTPTPKPTTALNPLGASRYKVQFTASQQLHDKLRQAQALLRHELPDGELAQVVDRALDLLIADRMKRRFGQTSKPRKARDQGSTKPNTRHIPHDVKRQVLLRDGTRCSFVSPNGRRCEQNGWLELDHEQPFGRGGSATADNIRVLCRAHNKWSAERAYGREFILHRIAQARAQKPRTPARTEPQPAVEQR